MISLYEHNSQLNELFGSKPDTSTTGIKAAIQELKNKAKALDAELQEIDPSYKGRKFYQSQLNTHKDSILAGKAAEETTKQQAEAKAKKQAKKQAKQRSSEKSDTDNTIDANESADYTKVKFSILAGHYMDLVSTDHPNGFFVFISNARDNQTVANFLNPTGGENRKDSVACLDRSGHMITNAKTAFANTDLILTLNSGSVQKIDNITGVPTVGYYPLHLTYVPASNKNNAPQ